MRQDTTLITVFNNKRGEPTVNARDLHESMGGGAGLLALDQAIYRGLQARARLCNLLAKNDEQDAWWSQCREDELHGFAEVHPACVESARGVRGLIEGRV